MNYFIDKDEEDNILVHKIECKTINIFRQDFFPDIFETYDQAKEYATKKEKITKSTSKNCSCCNPTEQLNI